MAIPNAMALTLTCLPPTGIATSLSLLAMTVEGDGFVVARLTMTAGRRSGGNGYTLAMTLSEISVV